MATQRRLYKLSLSIFLKTLKSILDQILHRRRMEAKAGPSAGEEEVSIETLINEILTVTVKDLGITLEEISFQGFKPREYLAAMQQLAKAANTDMNTHKTNLVLLGLVCAVRGSKINKIIASENSTAALEARLGNLRSLYNITDGKPVKGTTATLPRMLAITALPVSLIIYKGREKVFLPLTPEEIAFDFPFVFCMSHAEALIPAESKPQGGTVKGLAYAQYLMTQKFGGKATKQQILQFVLVAARSDMWTYEQKKANLIKVGILKNNGTHLAKVGEGLQIAAQKFDALPWL